MASLNGHVEVVNILLQNGAHVDIPKKVILTFSRDSISECTLLQHGASVHLQNKVKMQFFCM